MRAHDRNRNTWPCESAQCLRCYRTKRSCPAPTVSLVSSSPQDVRRRRTSSPRMRPRESTRCMGGRKTNPTKTSTQKVCAHRQCAAAPLRAVLACSDARGASRLAIFRHALLAVHGHGGGQPVCGRNRFLATTRIVSEHACACLFTGCIEHSSPPFRLLCNAPGLHNMQTPQERSRSEGCLPSRAF